MVRVLPVATALVPALLACGVETAPDLPKTLEEPVGAYDVSVLFPLPEPGQQTSMIGADAVGARGVLLPRARYAELPLIDVALNNDQSYGLLRVVSARLDPCFPGLGEPCEAQIRLVLQPILPSPVGDGLVANDAAVHLFYSLSRDELEAALRLVVELRVRAGFGASDAPLGVHPALEREGVDGPFARGLRAALLTYAGEENLVRVTFMALEGFSDQWRFGGYDVVGGSLVPMQIPGIGSTEQEFLNEDRTGAGFSGVKVAPPSSSADEFSLLLDPIAAAGATAEARAAAFGAALRVESPDRHSPASVDCVTCHVAAPARAFAERTFGLSAVGSPDQWVAADGAAPEGATELPTNGLRAFGILGRAPAVSQRVANETAAVVALVNAEMVGR